VDTPSQRFLFGRHFALLFIMAAVLAAVMPSRPLGIKASFALYGALHALALVLGLRGPRHGLRALSFVGIASMLCAVTVELGLAANRLAGLLTISIAPRWTLALCAAFGAATYGAVINGFWRSRLSWPAVGMIAAICAAAVSISVRINMMPKTADGLWIALPWWFAFSTGFYCDELVARKIP
jgi:hypothetical protein